MTCEFFEVERCHTISQPGHCAGNAITSRELLFRTYLKIINIHLEKYFSFRVVYFGNQWTWT